MAIRSATAMGLNLRSESNYVTLASKESRYKVWWSLYTLETILGNMTGRPLNVERDFCTTPLPVPFEEHEYSDTKVIRMMSELKIRNSLLGHVVTRPVGETFMTVDAQSVRNAMETLKPNTPLYFVCFIDLTRIIREIVETLYAPEIVQNISRDAGGAITDANIKLEAWLSKLPAGFRFLGEEQRAMRDRYSLSLALHFYSTKILACKPCLHYSDRPVAGDDKFYDRIAASCVQAARRMLDLFPAKYDASWLNQVAPWWCILHYLVQATAVLLIDFPLNQTVTAAAAGGSAVEPRQALEKAASWLNEMALRDMASQRACTICASLLRKLSHVVSRDEEARFSEVGLYR
jgi:Fungal specific transcription factor domain